MEEKADGLEDENAGLKEKITELDSQNACLEDENSTLKNELKD